jgi:hypothetical protein
MQDLGYELPRKSIPRTRLNKPVYTFAILSSQIVATKTIRLGDVLGAYGCYLLRLGERKDKIVGTIAEPRECRISTTLASQAKRPFCSNYYYH